MIFDVAGALHFRGQHAAALEFMEDLAIGLGHHIGQHVEPAAMRHAEHDFLHAQLAAALDDLFQRGDHRLAAVESEPLGADEAQRRELFETFGLDQLVEDRALAFFRERDFLVGSFDPALQPILLLRIVDVHELVADRPAIGALEDLHDAPRARGFHAQHAVDVDGLVELGFVEAVEIGIELRQRRLLAELQRIEVGCEMADDAIGAHKLDGAGWIPWPRRGYRPR